MHHGVKCMANAVFRQDSNLNLHRPVKLECFRGLRRLRFYHSKKSLFGKETERRKGIMDFQVAAQDHHIFVSFSAIFYLGTSSSGRTQTLDLGMRRRVYCHCAPAAGQQIF